jgi:hypothetical protein
VGEPELVGHGESGEDVAEIAVKLLLRAEGQPTGVGVQSVGADDEAEGAGESSSVAMESLKRNSTWSRIGP